MKKKPAESSVTPLHTEAGQDAKKGKAAKSAPSGFGIKQIFSQDVSIEETVLDEKDIISRYKRLQTLLRNQAIAIGILTGILIFGSPVMRPYYIYRTIAPDRTSTRLVALSSPNLTKNAVLSWAATSVTEIMTLGFGDFDQQLTAQRQRFTQEGWLSFLKAIAQQNIRDAFKEQQLILTTVPTDVPVLLQEGEDPEHDYQWVVELPVIMTYATNNNVTRKSRGVVRLTIVRVPGQENIQGLGIDKWNFH